jgi:hypothetical protein
VPSGDGSGMEVMEACLQGEDGDYLVATYAMRGTLIELVGPTLRRGQEVAFAEPDGTRLATVGAPRRSGSRIFTSQQLIDLPGVTLMLRVDGWRAEPDLFPNLLTGLVTGVSIALISVLPHLIVPGEPRIKVRRGIRKSGRAVCSGQDGGLRYASIRPTRWPDRAFDRLGERNRRQSFGHRITGTRPKSADRRSIFNIAVGQVKSASSFSARQVTPAIASFSGSPFQCA